MFAIQAGWSPKAQRVVVIHAVGHVEYGLIFCRSLQPAEGIGGDHRWFLDETAHTRQPATEVYLERIVIREAVHRKQKEAVEIRVYPRKRGVAGAGNASRGRRPEAGVCVRG